MFDNSAVTAPVICGALTRAMAAAVRRAADLADSNTPAGRVVIRALDSDDAALLERSLPGLCHAFGTASDVERALADDASIRLFWVAVSRMRGWSRHQRTMRVIAKVGDYDLAQVIAEREDDPPSSGYRCFDLETCVRRSSKFIGADAPTPPPTDSRGLASPQVVRLRGSISRTAPPLRASLHKSLRVFGRMAHA